MTQENNCDKLIPVNLTEIYSLIRLFQLVPTRGRILGAFENHSGSIFSKKGEFLSNFFGNFQTIWGKMNVRASRHKIDPKSAVFVFGLGTLLFLGRFEPQKTKKS